MIRLLTVALAALSASAFAPASLVRTTTTTTTPSIVSDAPVSFQNLNTQRNALATAELPEKLYFPKEKEMPKVLGGIKIGLRKLCVITGASSGLGLYTALELAKTGRYFIVMACRDVEKAKRGTWLCCCTFVLSGIHNGLSLTLHTNPHHFMFCFRKTVAKEKGMPEGSYVVMKLELGNLQSVRDFVANLKAFKSARPLTHLICNAAVYKPKDPNPAWTDDGFEMSMGVNHLGHFLLVNLLLEDMSRAKGARVCIVGSITGNTNTVGGGLVYPFADLGKLQGFEKGMKKPISMADGKPFFGAKAYKDSKVRYFC